MKSKRTYTKRRSDLTLLFCAGVIVYTLVARAESAIAEVVVTFAFMTAAAVLGVYQAVGHADFRTSAKKVSDDPE